VGPRTGLDAVVKRKIPSPCWDSNPRSSSPLFSTIHSFFSIFAFYDEVAGMVYHYKDFLYVLITM
jgi:hypothetical protein